MYKKLCFILMIISIGSLTNISAQNNNELNSRRKVLKWDFNWQWNSDSRPMIEVNYGLGEPKHSNFESSFSKVGLAELKIGYSSLDDYYRSPLLELEEKYFYASNISTELKSEDNDLSKLDSDLWRFGVGIRSGYGYNAGSVAIIPYIQYSLDWSKLNMKEFPDTTMQSDVETLNKYNNSFRFGTSSEGGIKIEFASFLALNASYETSVIFPRHLFWRHLGSVIVELMGYTTIDYFVDEIIDSSPAAGPILNFLLKAGYSYAFYHLKKDKMNWPFASESPLTFEIAKVGVTFAF
ncbi:MAG: hypothetical protein A2V66_03110 [Ignavibacteria bacterium RBG_13_36_8]|nr:MAG: hypothetical protein A2V66_03110 [Ignavibacteria bacterium RBG_13_36_8]